MKLKSSYRAGAVIPTASMADIAFLLIIFFMVTTTHQLDRTRVNLPLAANRVEAQKGAAIVVLEWNKATQEAGYHFSDGEETSNPIPGPDFVYVEATTLTTIDPTQPFILKADGEAPYEKVDALLDAMRRGGVGTVILLSQQGEGIGEE